MSTRTLSEIRATCAKAARGAGCPWGLAEEAGLAVRVLEAHGLPGTETLAGLFQTPRACPCSGDKGGPACGLAEMAALSDDLPAKELSLDNVAAPLLLVAGCIQDARDGNTWRIDWSEGAVTCGLDGVDFTGTMPSVATHVEITRCDPPKTPTSPDWRSRDVPEGAWAFLEGLAAHTYVPETDASRAAGAGPDGGDAD